ncbi:MULTISPECIES: DUF2459 domain-containing protein [unclassified Cyanobium]|uniref:DUF2459 domain-containing protein n=1 Tax=unclassified Cyanobium TaxID=2627006 RepID=UPI0020CF1AD4|nr:MULTISPECIES: DUF2459 domain-containing protein [unclassified Cyanobium]MCP9860850.1 DUF2459 domain-containing protein [Cyanobium sp. Cruz-8H5]MCP9868086.1 DUF2459 domain-containing protein [Cyanobium sp. Cruz-8D1]
MLALLLELVGRPLLQPIARPEPRAQLAPLPLPPAGPYTVLVADWGHHTSIVVQQPPGWRLGPPGAEAAPFVEVAWGDRRYFHGADRSPQALAAALFLPTDSVLFLAGHPDPPRLQGTVAVWQRQVEAPTLQALLTALERSAQRTPAGERRAPLPSRPDHGGRFVHAHGAYLWTRNCNWWTVQRLREAGLATDPTGVVVAAQVPGRLRGFRPLES